jgi:hypothetical protein
MIRTHVAICFLPIPSYASFWGGTSNRNKPQESK